MPTANAAAAPRLSRSPRVSAELALGELVDYVCHELPPPFGSILYRNAPPVNPLMKRSRNAL